MLVYKSLGQYLCKISDDNDGRRKQVLCDKFDMDKG